MQLGRGKRVLISEKHPDLVGSKFNKLTILQLLVDSKNAYKAICLCMCECGNLKETSLTNIAKGYVMSCGCLYKEAATKRDNYEHGYWNKRIYNVFTMAKQRCTNPKATHYGRYGGRGIRMEFKNAKEFIDWALANGYQDNLSLDRIDGNGPYSPENCRWVSKQEQSNNTSSNLKFTIFGEELTLAQAVRKYSCGLTYRQVYVRVTEGGWDIIRALGTPPKGSIPNWDLVRS